MAEPNRGPLCGSELRDDWNDAGTNRLGRSSTPGTLGICPDAAPSDLQPGWARPRAALAKVGNVVSRALGSLAQSGSMMDGRQMLWRPVPPPAGTLVHPNLQFSDALSDAERRLLIEAYEGLKASTDVRDWFRAAASGVDDARDPFAAAAQIRVRKLGDDDDTFPLLVESWSWGGSASATWDPLTDKISLEGAMFTRFANMVDVAQALAHELSNWALHGAHDSRDPLRGSYTAGQLGRAVGSILWQRMLEQRYAP